MNPIRRSPLATLVLALLCLRASGWAGDSSKTEVLREVVVTATRAETQLDTTGTTVSVISEKDLVAAHYANVQDALRSVPGLDLVTTGTPGQTTGVFTRGTNTNHTIVTIDGRRLPFDFAGGYDLTNLSLDNVERIEVLRGPSSSVYGGNALGGVINLVTKSGQGLSRPTASLTVEGGSFGTFREGLSAAGNSQGVDFSLEASRLDTDYQRANSEYRRTSTLGKVGYQATPELYLDTTFRYALTDAGTPAAESSPPDFDNNFLRETWSVSPGVTWNTTDVWTQKVFYSHNQQRTVATGFTGLFDTNFRAQVDSDQVDYQSEIEVLSNLRLTVGGSLEDYRISRYNDTLGFQDIDQTETRSAVFAQTQWEALTGWHWTANVRFDSNSDFGNAVTFRLGQSYRLAPTQTLFHANYGTAFAPPAPQNTAVAFFGNPDVKSETSKGYEIGVEQPFWNEKISVGATWFHNDIRNLITFDLTTFTLLNTGRAKTEGVEWFGKVKPLENVTLKVGYTYLTAEDLGNQARLVRRPRHRLTADAIYQPIPQVTLTSGLQWVVAREDFNAATFAQEDQEDYTVARFTAAWDATKWLQLFGRVENAFGENYAEANGFSALDSALYAGFKLKY